MTPRKKLIEVALPLEAVNPWSGNEKSTWRRYSSRPYPSRYVWRASKSEPEFPIASVNVGLRELLDMSEEPR
jgi:hypothetical protein